MIDGEKEGVVMATKAVNKNERRRLETCIYYDPRNSENPIEVKVTVKGKKPFVAYFAKNEIKKARDYRAWAYTQRANEKTIAKHNPTFREFADEYYKSKRAIAKRKETSDITTLSSLKNNVYPYIGNIDITKIKLTHIAEMQTKWYTQKSPLKYSSGNTIMSQVNAIFNNALKKHIIHENPVKGLDKPNVIRSEKKALELSEVEEVQEFCKTHGRTRCSYLSMLLMFNAGLRSGELRGLTWDKIQYKVVEGQMAGIIIVDTQWSDRLKKHITPKTHDSIREIPVPLYVMDELEKYREDNSAYVIHKIKEPFTPVSGDTISGYCKTVQRNTGIVFTPHTCRHTYASLMIMRGADLFYLAKYLGHSSVFMIMKTYAHLLKNGINKYLNCFNNDAHTNDKNGKLIA